MCGRFALTYPKPALEQLAQTSTWFLNGKPDNSYPYTPRYNVAPQQTVPVLRKLEHHRVLEWMQWSISLQLVSNDFGSAKHVDHFTRAPVAINIRSETALQKRCWRSILGQRQRAVIISSGFFEWTTQNPPTLPNARKMTIRIEKCKQRSVPYYIQFAAKPETSMASSAQEAEPTPLYMAALFDTRNGDTSRFAILTVPSTSNIEWLHDRMPAILDTNDKLETWLDTENTNSQDAMHHCIGPCSQVTWYSLSDNVSNPRNDYSEILLPSDAAIQLSKQRGIPGFFHRMKREQPDEPRSAH